MKKLFKRQLRKELQDELDKEFLFWNNKLSKMSIDQKHKSFYVMGVLGGLRVAMRLLERLK
jgi:hypothetical protein